MKTMILASGPNRAKIVAAQHNLQHGEYELVSTLDHIRGRTNTKDQPRIIDDSFRSTDYAVEILDILRINDERKDAEK